MIVVTLTTSEWGQRHHDHRRHPAQVLKQPVIVHRSAVAPLLLAPLRHRLCMLPPALLRTAAAQDGVVTRRQALDAGLSSRQVEWLVREGGSWQIIIRGVYATFTGPLTARHRQRAAVLHGGPEAQLTALMACVLLQLRYVPSTVERPHILVPHTVQPASSDAVKVQRTLYLPRPWWVDGLPVSPIDRAVVEGARQLTRLRDVRALMCEAVQRGRTTVERLHDRLREGPSRGSALPRRTLADLRAGCRSAPECELRDLLLTSTVICDVEFNAKVEVDGLVVGVPDALVRRLRLAFEVDSEEHHAIGEDQERTMRRRVGFAARQWMVVSFSPRRIRAEPAAVLRDAESVYLARAAELGA